MRYRVTTMVRVLEIDADSMDDAIAIFMEKLGFYPYPGSIEEVTEE